MKTTIEQDDDDASVVGSHSHDGSVPGSLTQSTDPESQNESITKQESKVVGRFKLAFLSVIIASAIIVATSAYIYLARAEQHSFSTAFHDDATKVLEAVQTSLDKTLGLLDTLAVLYVSTARITNQTWPFVVMQDFGIRLAKILPLTDAINVNLLPIVSSRNRIKWEKYSVQHDDWVNATMAVQEKWKGYYGPRVYQGTEKHGVIHSDLGDLPYNLSRDFLPNWQNFPVIPNTLWTYNTDWVTVSFSEAYQVAKKHHTATISIPYMIPAPGDELREFETDLWEIFYKDYIPPDEVSREPMADIAYPVVDDISQVETTGAEHYVPNETSIKALLVASMFWRDTIRDILPHGSDGIHIVFDNACTDAFTYELRGPEVRYMGVGDHHDEKYNGHGKEAELNDLGRFLTRESTYSGAPLDKDYCPMTLRLYPSDVLRAAHVTNNPIVFTAVVILIFAFATVVFGVYDREVERRQQRVQQKAANSSAIISSLFPSTVRHLLFAETDTAPQKKNKLDLFSRDIDPAAPANSGNAAPIAELHPETTVLFADIAGFISWSSTRQPSQVFTLLETVYAAFDTIAKQRGVFKVETVGDCYVAVVGLPSPRKRHAVVMARFANDCRVKMRQIASELEEVLGPGTADLSLRCGLNSGPTTAGVLRGEKSRFQLFGDTVNTAARMESSGSSNRIHVSKKSAELIKAAGKEHWLTLRTDPVNCKGKGVMTTYWCRPNDEGAEVDFDQDNVDDTHDSRLQRQINWNVDMLSNVLHELVSQQNSQGIGNRGNFLSHCPSSQWNEGKPIDEVVEVLSFPDPNERQNGECQAEPVTIDATVVVQLRELVSSIADLYRDNPFHNFEHCCHVAMSTRKLLQRIKEGESKASTKSCAMGAAVSAMIADPLAQFALIFAALIHDVDHPGVSNAQLIQEGHVMATTYDNRSVAEQNSIDIAMRLLTDPKFAALRACLFASEGHEKRFRQIVLNAVMATDLFDAQLKNMRESRWETSFPKSSADDALAHSDCDRRATIIIELIVQASDVSHTMQHFTVYQKWNMNLLTEMYAAYKCGRSAKDPLDGWYDGELWFFDNYIIPLAQKLRECNVFGVSCDEFSDYARDNRMEWEIKGRSIVEEARARLQHHCTTQQTAVPLRIDSQGSRQESFRFL